MQIADELILPCQPRVLALLMRELLSDVPNMRRVNQLFGLDPVLALQLLACANSSAFQMPAMVHGIPQAITLLGVRQLRLILKKAQSGIVVRGAQGVDVGQFAQLSVACAKLARSLAGMVRLDASVAYAAGLLHAMGHLILHLSQPERVAPVRQDAGIWDPRRPRVEVRHWGYSTNSTTAALLKQWSFPAEIICAIQGMETPLVPERFDPMAGVLHLAAWRHRAKASGWTERSIADAFPVEVALALGLDVDVVLQQDATDWSQSLY